MKTLEKSEPHEFYVACRVRYVHRLSFCYFCLCRMLVAYADMVLCYHTEL